MTQERAEPRWWQRLLQIFPSSRVGAELFSRIAHPTDLLLMRLSDGRISTARLLAGLPTVRLTTVGAKTGKKRTVPVMGMQDGKRWILVASNWGEDEHPAWYHNLRANPEVELTYKDETNRYVAREATTTERPEYWDQAQDMYRGFEAYRRRSGDRRIPIVVLTPTEE